MSSCPVQTRQVLKWQIWYLSKMPNRNPEQLEEWSHLVQGTLPPGGLLGAEPSASASVASSSLDQMRPQTPRARRALEARQHEVWTPPYAKILLCPLIESFYSAHVSFPSSVDGGASGSVGRAAGGCSRIPPCGWAPLGLGGRGGTQPGPPVRPPPPRHGAAAGVGGPGGGSRARARVRGADRAGEAVRQAGLPGRRRPAAVQAEQVPG